MSLFDEMQKGILDAIEYEKGNKEKAKSRTISIAELPSYQGNQVKRIRLRNHLTQSTFAGVLGVSIKTVEKWENGTNVPSGPAQRLLYMIDTNEGILTKNNIVNVS